MEAFKMNFCIRGYHVYNRQWEAAIGERLECSPERENASDPFTVSCVKREGRTVGHLPLNIAPVTVLF